MQTVQFDDVRAAAARVCDVIHRTPVMTSATLDAMTGLKVYFKCENFQRVGAFKMRGAYNALSQFDAHARKRGVLTASSGNHAQAVACSAALLDIPAKVVMPHDAPAMKVAATKGYGAEVVFYDRYTEDRDAVCNAVALSSGMTIVPPFNHPDVIAGQGTVALEFLEQVPQLDALCAPLGGGGLLAGTALAAKSIRNNIRVFGCEPLAGNDGLQSFQTGEILRIAPPQTIADGAQTTALGDLTFPIIQQYVEDIVCADDRALVTAMRFHAERMKLWVEPTGCLGLGALLSGALSFAPGTHVGIILSGGNMDSARFSQLIQAFE